MRENLRLQLTHHHDRRSLLIAVIVEIVVLLTRVGIGDFNPSHRLRDQTIVLEQRLQQLIRILDVVLIVVLAGFGRCA